jgi:hypothetical protein
MRRRDAKKVLSDYKRWIDTDVHARPVDPSLLDDIAPE